MAYKKQRKRSRNSKNFAAIGVAGSLSLVTLADNTIADASLTSENLLEDLYVISTDLEIQVRGLTAGELATSSFGLAHSDYTVAQLLEKLDNEYLGPGDKIEQERSRRVVRPGASLYADGPSASATVRNAIGRNGSRYIRTKCRFIINSGRSLNIYLWNRSGAALTTGSTLKWTGTIYGRWLI